VVKIFTAPKIQSDRDYCVIYFCYGIIGMKKWKNHIMLNLRLSLNYGKKNALKEFPRFFPMKLLINCPKRFSNQLIKTLNRIIN